MTTSVTTVAIRREGLVQMASRLLLPFVKGQVNPSKGNMDSVVGMTLDSCVTLTNHATRLWKILQD